MKSIYDRLKSLAFSNGVKLLLACAVVFAISYFYLLYYRNAFYDLTADEGYIIYGAKRVLDGQILYKDFFQFYPPGDFYLLAFVFKLFGYSFIMARETAVVIDSLINTLLFYFSYKAIRSWYAILPPLFFLILGYPNWMQYSHYWSSMLFLFISLAFFLIYLEQKKSIYIFSTGIFTGITGLFLQTPAAYVSLLLLFLLISEGRQGLLRKVLFYVAGIGIPLIIAFGFIAYQGALLDFISQQYFMSKIYPEAVTFNPIALYFRHFGKYSIIFILYTSIAIISGGALIFFRKKLSHPVKIIFIGNIVLFFTSSSRMDFDHILVNSAMVFVVVLLPVKWLLDYLKHKHNWGFKGAIIAWNITAVILVLWGVISMKTNIHNIHTSAYHLNFNGTSVWTFNQKEAYKIKEFFPEAKKMLGGDQSVFVYQYCPIINVFMHLHNPVYIDWIPALTDMPDYGPYGFERAVQELIKKKTQYIIYCNWPQDYIDAVLKTEGKLYHVNVLDKYIASAFTPILKVNELILYKKHS